MTLLLLFLFQVLRTPDPAQMEKAPELGVVPVAFPIELPDGKKLGAPASVAVVGGDRLLIFNRSDTPLVEVDREGKFVRAFGQGRYSRPHGMRVDPQGNIWTTDVVTHTVTKMSPHGDVLLVLGTKGRAGSWSGPDGPRLLNEPTDVAFGAGGDVFVVQGHGRGEPRVLRFDKDGQLLASWGGAGTSPGLFDTPHSIVVDAMQTVYVADRQNRRVQLFDVNGRYIREWRFAGLPCGLFLAEDGHVFLVTGLSGQLLKLDANGRAIGATGRPGKGLGEFGEAHYLAVGPEGDIYVADTVNAVLHKFVQK